MKDQETRYDIVKYWCRKTDTEFFGVARTIWSSDKHVRNVDMVAACTDYESAEAAHRLLSL